MYHYKVINIGLLGVCKHENIYLIVIIKETSIYGGDCFSLKTQTRH